MNRYLLTIFFTFAIIALARHGVAANSQTNPLASAPQQKEVTSDKPAKSLQDWNHLLNKYEGVYDEEAVAYCERIISMANANQMKKQAAYGYSRLGEVYNFLQKDSLAIEAFNKAAELYSRQGLRDSLKRIYISLIELHRLADNIREATDRQKSLLELTEFFEEKEASAIAKRDLAALLARQEQFNQAFKLLKESGIYFEQQQDTANLISNKQLLVTILHNHGNTVHALKEIDQAISLLEESQDERKALLYYQKSLLLLETGDEENGIGVLQKTLKLARDANANQLVSKASEKLVEIYENKADYQKALEYQKVFMKSREALLTQSGAEAISVIGKQMKRKSFSQDNNSSESTNMRNQNNSITLQLYIFVGVIVFLVLQAIIIVWLISGNRKLKKLISSKPETANNTPFNEENTTLTKATLQSFEQLFSGLMAILESSDDSANVIKGDKRFANDRRFHIEIIEVIKYLIQLKSGETVLKNQEFELNALIKESIGNIKFGTVEYKIDNRLYKRYSADKKLLFSCVKLLAEGALQLNQSEHVNLLIEPIGENLNYVDICACNRESTQLYEKSKVTEKTQLRELSLKHLDQQNNIALLILSRLSTAGGGRLRVMETSDNNHIYSLVLPLHGTE